MPHDHEIVITLTLAARTDEHPGQTVEVRLASDGTATVTLRAVLIARKDVTGPIEFDTHAAVTSNRVADSFVHQPLRPHVLRAAENRARACLQRARTATARVLAAHTPTPRTTT